jgi:hypothetical protein
MRKGHTLMERVSSSDCGGGVRDVRDVSLATKVLHSSGATPPIQSHALAVHPHTSRLSAGAHDRHSSQPHAELAAQSRTLWPVAAASCCACTRILQVGLILQGGRGNTVPQT